MFLLSCVFVLQLIYVQLAIRYIARMFLFAPDLPVYHGNKGSLPEEALVSISLPALEA
jgi:hypothetical protein